MVTDPLTHPQTHKQTGPITLQDTGPQLTHSVIIGVAVGELRCSQTGEKSDIIPCAVGDNIVVVVAADSCDVTRRGMSGN